MQPLMEAAPSMKVAVPEGVPLPGARAVTVAVEVTFSPDTDGSTDEITTVAVAPWLTVSVRIGDVEPLKLESPLYTAVSGCAPAAAKAAAHTAVPAADTACAAQPVIVTPPSSNITVPVRVPIPGAITLTDAVMVTDWPATEGFTDDARAVDVNAGFTVCVKVGDVEPAKLMPPE